MLSTRLTVLAAGAAALILSSCGGGSGGAGSGTSPIPSPTSTPTPTPTPTGTASPAPSYDTAFELTRDRFFQLEGAELSATATSGSTGFSYSAISGRLLEPVTNPTFVYTAASQQSSVTLSNGAPQVYSASQISLRDTDRLIYTTPTGTLSYAQPGLGIGGFGTPLRYTVLIAQDDQTRNSSGNLDVVSRRLVGGVPTVSSDVPRIGSATYRVLFTSYAISPTGSGGFTAQNADVSIDYATGALRGTITATSTASNRPGTIVLNVVGQVSTSAGRMTGSLSTADGGAGQFTGELLGPQGVEFGIALAFSRGDQQLIGTIAGSRR